MPAASSSEQQMKHRNMAKGLLGAASGEGYEQQLFAFEEAT